MSRKPPKPIPAAVQVEILRAMREALDYKVTGPDDDLDIEYAIDQKVIDAQTVPVPGAIFVKRERRGDRENISLCFSKEPAGERYKHGVRDWTGCHTTLNKMLGEYGTDGLAADLLTSIPVFARLIEPGQPKSGARPTEIEKKGQYALETMTLPARAKARGFAPGKPGPTVKNRFDYHPSYAVRLQFHADDTDRILTSLAECTEHAEKKLAEETRLNRDDSVGNTGNRWPEPPRGGGWRQDR